MSSDLSLAAKPLLPLSRRKAHIRLRTYEPVILQRKGVSFYSELGFDEFLYPLTPAQAKPERAVFLLRYQFKSEEGAAKTLARNELRDQKNSRLLGRKAESVAVRQVLNLLDGGAHPLRHHFMTFSPFGVQRQHIAGKGRLLSCFFLLAFVLIRLRIHDCRAQILLWLHIRHRQASGLAECPGA